jgi:KTSC domain
MVRVVQRKAIASRALVSVGYDSTTRQLELEFSGGRVYRYRDVPPGAYEFLLRSASKGGYVNRMITGHYAYDDVTPKLPERAQELRDALEASLRERSDL